MNQHLVIDTMRAARRRASGQRTLLLRSADLHATFLPERGMHGLSLRHRGEQLLAPAGIPLLHPWANRLAEFSYRGVSLDRGSRVLQVEEHGLPIHGAHSAGRWRTLGSGAELDWAAHDDLMEVFPYPHRARIEAELSGATLVIRTSVTASGEAEVPIAFGFHPYFHIPGVARDELLVELPARDHLVLDERLLPTGERTPRAAERAPLGDRAFDDLFAVGDAPTAFAITGAGRELRVQWRSGYSHAQVFAPAGEDFICFEPMTAPVNALRTGDGLRLLAPGETFTAAFAITVRNNADVDGTGRA
jgi:aldose 1-epimerase